MAQNEDAVVAPVSLAVNLPPEGNTKHDPKKDNLNINPLNDSNLTPEERLHLANLEIEKREKLEAEKKKEEEKNKDKNKDKSNSTDDNEDDKTNVEDDLTEEEIEAKFKEIEAKKEEELTDEDKAFVEKYTEADEISTVKKDFEATYGIKLEKEYENNPEGLKLLASDVAPIIGEQMFMQYLETVPYMKDFFDHVVIEGKGIETFLAKNEKPAFESIEVKPLTEVDEAVKPKMIDGFKQLIKLDLQSKGVSDDTIATLTDLYESKGTLYDEAKKSKEALGKVHKANIDIRIKQEEAAIKAQQDAINQEITQVREMITKNNINGTAIPQGDVKAFQDAMFRPIDQTGRTALDVMREKLTLGQRTLIDYIVFKNFNVKGLTPVNPETKRSFSFAKDKKENDKRVRRLGSNSGDNRIEKPGGEPVGLDIKKVMRTTI